MDPQEPGTSKPSLESLTPRVSGWRWSLRFGVIVLTVCVLAWSWQQSGMSESGMLWSNRERAVDYLLGQPVDESTLEQRRLQVLRDLRTEYQVEARAQIESEFQARGEQLPGLMTLMRLSEERAAQLMEALPESEIDQTVRARLEAQGQGASRQGGYFPPETDPRAVFGDPEDLDDLHPLVAWVVRAADGVGGSVRSVVRWTLSGVTGDGYTGQLFETVAIALWGTVLAVLLSIPASLLGSQRSMEILWPGQSPAHRCGRWFGRFVVRRSFDIARGFNEIVLAMIFVAVLGLGPLPGVLALLIHTYGVLGKVFSEAIETIDRGPVEGVQSTGASSTHVVAFSVLPQINPYIVSQSLLRFESNVRGATILGVVGAGGIGQLLMDKFGAYEFQEVASMMIIIIVVVTLIDFGCTQVMRRFV